MKKSVLILVAMVLLIIVASGLIIVMERNNERYLGGQRIKDLAEYVGVEYLGIIDATAISKNSGYVYNGPAITQEVLKRAGLDADSDVWMTYITTTIGGVDAVKMTVYESGQEDIPQLQRKVKAEYFYGEI